MSAADPRSWMWAEACAMIERAEQLHRRFFQPGLAPAAAVNWEPPVDVFVRQLPACVHGAAIHRMEIPHGRFERRIRLPGERWQVDRSALVNGCLVLSLTPQRG
jgi:HSP20 family protein